MSHTNLWAPWRMAYLRDLQNKIDALGDVDETSPRFLDDYWEHPENDERNHVVYRNAHGMVLLNRYPYANGHLLVALGAARPTLLEYEADQRSQFWKLVEIATDLMTRTLEPQGINLGINQGRAAGAGVPEHLHAHLVPRWGGDTNFMTIVSQVRVIPDSLDVMAEQYRLAAARLK